LIVYIKCSEPDAVYSSTGFYLRSLSALAGNPTELPPRAARPAGALAGI